MMVYNRKQKICLVYNYAQHYRSSIFTLMDRVLQCDFVFGDSMDDVKKMDYSALHHFKKEVENRTFLFKPLYYQKGVMSLLWEEYSVFLILGDLHCISTWGMLLLSRFAKKKVYLWSHGWYGRETFFKKVVKKIYFKLADGTFLYGNYARDLMIKSGISESKLFVIYNSLAYDEQLQIRENLRVSTLFQSHFQNQYANLIFIGRLTKVKRLDLLLDALVVLKSKSILVNLTLIGDGIMIEELKSQVQYKDLLENIWFFGACYEEATIADLIYNADLCVSPGNVGLTAIHALAYGTPVLTHDNFPYQMPEFEAIREGETGAFFKYENYESLAEVIKQWLLKVKDRNAIRRKCFEVVDSFYNPYKQIEILLKYLPND